MIAANARKTNARGEAISAADEVGAEVDVEVPLEEEEEEVLDAELVKEPIFLLIVIHLTKKSWETYWSWRQSWRT